MTSFNFSALDFTDLEKDKAEKDKTRKSVLDVKGMQSFPEHSGAVDEYDQDWKGQGEKPPQLPQPNARMVTQGDDGRNKYWSNRKWR